MGDVIELVPARLRVTKRHRGASIPQRTVSKTQGAATAAEDGFPAEEGKIWDAAQVAAHFGVTESAVKGWGRKGTYGLVSAVPREDGDKWQFTAAVVRAAYQKYLAKHPKTRTVKLHDPEAEDSAYYLSKWAACLTRERDLAIRRAERLQGALDEARRRRAS